MVLIVDGQQYYQSQDVVQIVCKLEKNIDDLEGSNKWQANLIRELQEMLKEQNASNME